MVQLSLAARWLALAATQGCRQGDTRPPRGSSVLSAQWARGRGRGRGESAHAAAGGAVLLRLHGGRPLQPQAKAGVAAAPSAKAHHAPPARLLVV